MKTVAPMDSVQEFYDQQSRRSRKDIFFQAFREAISYSYSLLQEISGKKVLEIGCGSGKQACYFAAQGAEVTGIDISLESLNAAERRAQAHNLSLYCISYYHTSIVKFEFYFNLHHLCKLLFFVKDFLYRFPKSITSFMTKRIIF